MLASALGKGASALDLKELHFIEQDVTGEEFNSNATLNRHNAIELAAKLLAKIRNGYFFGANYSEFLEHAEKILSSRGNIDAYTTSGVYSCITLAEAELNGKKVAIDQTPRNIFYISIIHNNLPYSKIVCLVRDPRDVCLSQKRKWKRRFLGGNIPIIESIRAWANYHPLVTTKIWVQGIKKALRFNDGNQILIVKYEDLVTNPEFQLKKICSFCDIQFSTNMLNVSKKGSSHQNDQDMTLGIDKSRVSAWKKGGLSNSEIYSCNLVAGEILDELHYEQYKISHRPISFYFLILILPFKIVISLLFNLTRVSNLKSWLINRIK